MWPLLLAGLAAGAVKSFAFDKPRYDRAKNVVANQNTFSPWTGKSYDYPNEPDLAGPMMQGALAGASFGQGLDRDASMADLTKAQTNFYNRQPGSLNPWNEVGGGGRFPYRP